MGGRAMMCKVYEAFIISVGVALTLASNQALGQSVASHGGVSASTHSPFHSSFIRWRHRDNRRNAGTFFPAAGGYFWGSSNGQPVIEAAQPLSGDIHYTYTLDVPWDWVHRYPPSFFASPPEAFPPPVPHAPGCAAQTVTVPGADGKDQTITMVRC